MEDALIVSLNFRVAHVSHLVASYRQLEELGYNSILYIHPDTVPFLPQGIQYVTSLFPPLNNIGLAIFWFPAANNLKEMLRLKLRYKAKIIYVFHEPIESIKTYREFGLSIPDLIKTYIRYIYTLSFIFLANHIILPSNKAYGLYKRSIGRYVNSHYTMIPLLFADERTDDAATKQRKYFSYIGTIAHDHAYDEFVKFILQFRNDPDCPNNLKFLIATRNVVNRTEEILSAINEGVLIVQDGKPLTDDEINGFYAQTFCVWNAYHRTTQSGVLAKASMFGTPALVMKANLSEFAIDGQNVCCCNDNSDYNQIKTALLNIYNNFSAYSEKARMMFDTRFFYRNHNSAISNIISQM